MLGSINLSEFVDPHGAFDFEDFSQTVRAAVYALNEVLDEGLPLHPLKEQRDSVRDWRQIGLGIFGLADMLIKMGITYGSEESLKICDSIGFVMSQEALRESASLGDSYGSFGKCDIKKIKDSDYFVFNSFGDRELNTIKNLRNSQLLTIAPTGTLSTMLGVSGGIEPIFANYYERKTESLHGEDVYYKVYTPIVESYMKENGIKDDADLPEYFVTAQTIDYRDRIGMQAVWQTHIDASISSTVNVPNSFTVDEVEDLYMMAWKCGLKGITIFRDGCKRTGILTTTKNDPEKKTESKELGRGYVLDTSDSVIGKKRKLNTGCGSLHCTAFFDPITGDLMETYLSRGSTGGCQNFMVGLSRMISLAARSGCDIDSIVDQLDSCGVCPSYAVRSATKHDTSKGSCCPMAIGNAIREMWEEVCDDIGITDSTEPPQKENPQIVIPKEKPLSNKPTCPECGEPLIFEGGCNICKSCGWSKCG